MIEAVGLTKRYGAKTAVYNLSFQVRPGAVTGFLGPNGSGKSTTMRMILGLDDPTHGQVTIGGHHYRRLPNAPRQVGALLDAKAVHGGRSARSHLLCLAQLSGIPARRVDEVLGVVGLHEVAKKRSKDFSLGMGQRLGIAAALLGDPQVLLFDEPVNGLDPEGILWVRNLMKRLASEGRTVFVSSHLMSEMALTADQLIVIGRGQLLADMSVKEFISHNSADFARVRTPEGEATQQEKLTAALTEAGGHVQPEPDGSLRVTGVPLPRISDLAHSAQVRLWELSPHQASLEEAYMRLTQGAVDFRSTTDQRTGLQAQQVPPGTGYVPQGAPQGYGTGPGYGPGHGPGRGPGHPQPQGGWAPQPGGQPGGQPNPYATPAQVPPPQGGAQPYGAPTGQASPAGPHEVRPNPYAAPGSWHPAAPSGPTAPVATVAPSGPTAPVAPAAPTAPVAPVAPRAAGPVPGAAGSGTPMGPPAAPQTPAGAPDPTKRDSEDDR